MSRIVLSLCDYTGNMVKPWLEAGHECWIVDLQHKPGNHRDENCERLLRIGADVREWTIPGRTEVAIAFAFPPCTHLVVAVAVFVGMVIGRRSK